MRRTKRHSLGTGTPYDLSVKVQRVQFSCDASVLYYPIRTPGIESANVFAAQNLSIPVVLRGLAVRFAGGVSEPVFAVRFARAGSAPEQFLPMGQAEGSISPSEYPRLSRFEPPPPSDEVA